MCGSLRCILDLYRGQLSIQIWARRRYTLLVSHNLNSDSQHARLIFIFAIFSALLKWMAIVSRGWDDYFYMCVLRGMRAHIETRRDKWTSERWVEVWMGDWLDQSEWVRKYRSRRYFGLSYVLRCVWTARIEWCEGTPRDMWFACIDEWRRGNEWKNICPFHPPRVLVDSSTKFDICAKAI